MTRIGRMLIAVSMLLLSTEVLRAQSACTPNDQALFAQMQRMIQQQNYANLFDYAIRVPHIIALYTSAMTPACVSAMSGTTGTTASHGCSEPQKQAMVQWNGGINYRGPLRNCLSFPR